MTKAERRLGVISAMGSVLLTIAYAGTLIAGLLSLESQREPIGDPFFTMLELLILVLMPVMVALMAAVHAWTPPTSKTFALLAVVFVSLLAGSTCSVHLGRALRAIRSPRKRNTRRWRSTAIPTTWRGPSSRLTARPTGRSAMRRSAL